MEELLQKSLEKRVDFKDKELQNITFFQYLIMIYDYETAKFIQDSFGYDAEIIHLNALAALQMFDNQYLRQHEWAPILFQQFSSH